MGIQTREEWKEKTLEYLKERENQVVSVHDICSLYGLVPLELKNAVIELEKEDKVEIILDGSKKKWFKHKP